MFLNWYRVNGVSTYSAFATCTAAGRAFSIAARLRSSSCQAAVDRVFASAYKCARVASNFAKSSRFSSHRLIGSGLTGGSGSGGGLNRGQIDVRAEIEQLSGRGMADPKRRKDLMEDAQVLAPYACSVPRPWQAIWGCQKLIFCCAFLFRLLDFRPPKKRRANYFFVKRWLDGERN